MQIAHRDKMERLESEMRKNVQVELETRHYFAKGLYAREIVIPKDTLLTGLIHKFEQINICSGDITIVTDEGNVRLTGYHTVVSPPGTKRAGYAHDDTVWTTICSSPDEERDIEKLEAFLVTDSFDDPALAHLKVPEIT